ncbi:unnamed protein product [Chondrus crispus]|uniref:hydroxyacylglutathione hydrolase n=1 Tax=Chondrus crispus TaxID=2769 RepID=R7Q1F4_CHOCR|nr:unnamed protein product [Chondrus crispus]CDF32432.1 unnamed protein product [Chondrus crispus]|eukprot:XP_005712097.1 unnamed protein product [Chondrus crispus]
MLSAFITHAPSPLALRASKAVRHATTSNPARFTASIAPVPLNKSVDVHIVPILSDNFSYLIHDKKSNVAAVIDPADPRRLLSLANSLNVNLTTALVTHHHWDHAGGNSELAALVPGIEIVGSAYEDAEAVNVKMETGTSRAIKDSDLSYTALKTPCHTMGHICFYFQTEQPAVFSGDTLMVAGCGKFFEGDAADMEVSLNKTLAQLPDQALVFCGHEYTVTNLSFAQSVDPSNPRVKEKLAWAKEQVANHQPTVPSTIGDEKMSNPFMRTSRPELAEGLDLRNASAAEVMGVLRERKNNFRL